MALQDSNEIQALRERLTARAVNLREEVGAMRAEEAAELPHTPGDPVEDGGERGEEEARYIVRHAEQGRDTQELRDLDAAMARMDDGSYGECTDCAADIPLARLQARRRRRAAWLASSAPKRPAEAR